MTQTCKVHDDPCGCSVDLSTFLPQGFFKALADPSRLEILCHVATAGEPRTVSEVASCCPQSLSVVSRHLSALRDAGILRCTKVGREVRCEVAFDVVVRTLRDLADALEACCGPGASRTTCCTPASEGSTDP